MHINQKIASGEYCKEVPILNGPINVEAPLVAWPLAPILIVAQVAAKAGLRGKENGLARDCGVQRHIAVMPQRGEQGARACDEEWAGVGILRFSVNFFGESLPAAGIKEEGQIAITGSPEHRVFGQEFL